MIRVILTYYALFGVLHEGFHVLAAWYLGLFDVSTLTTSTSVALLAQASLGRYVMLPNVAEHATDQQACIIQHAGWMLSCFFALVLWLCDKKLVQTKHAAYASCGSPWTRAAMVTALEAICSDILGCQTRGLYFCGNFGIILIQSGSLASIDSANAMDLLQKMIEITMMRGAQSGGVVAWKAINNKNQPATSYESIRCRVVAGKRTDLAKDLRTLVQRKVVRGRSMTTRTLFGHTRFATASKATFQGTHPHRWTPPELRRVYPLDDDRLWNSTVDKIGPVVRSMENFVTHNGDLDFYQINGKLMALEDLQIWLENTTGHKRPASVDSAAIAGLVDVIRTAGCFGLSLRFSVLMKVKVLRKKEVKWPVYREYEKIGMVFEQALKEYSLTQAASLTTIKGAKEKRTELVRAIHARIIENMDNYTQGILAPFWDDVEEAESSSLWSLISATVDAFFDNDLFTTTKIFLRQAVGSFGLAITCSEDAGHQVCLAARGQPMSVAFYPDSGLICYGSELMAVKAGVRFESLNARLKMTKKLGDLTNTTSQFFVTSRRGSVPKTSKSYRLDLDDLGGEVALIDWTTFDLVSKEPVVKVSTHQESNISPRFEDRIMPVHVQGAADKMQEMSSDPIVDDLHDIPTALQQLQTEWKSGGPNRMAAWNLGRQLTRRLKSRAENKSYVHMGCVDILVTGCEVSLWLGEQFASDLQKAFPGLGVRAISSNKILGVFGQDLVAPAVGFPLSSETVDLKDSIVIIVSHSGGTFAPLALSSLLQSFTRNIFVVASELDTQIGKQLRDMSNEDGGIASSRIFSTNVGMRPAEPSSLSVAATHQVLTQLFQHIALVILGDQKLRHIAHAFVTVADLSILERCNVDNLSALSDIVGTQDIDGKHIETQTERELRQVGRLWADHVLEIARAYLMTFTYIFITVTIGHPLVSGIATAAGLAATSHFFYLTRFFDAAIYFFLPQINVTLVRLWQGRNLRHRMVGRTVVIGDIPWVAQCVDAFLSKIFARSYSIAGLNVLHGNPADHLVHRHTHRIVRGTLLICGRPDGRLPALTSAECAVNLSICQASSIQSLGGTCESITIGHNPSGISLTKADVVLNTFRPEFLSEHALRLRDQQESGRLNTQDFESRRNIGVNPKQQAGSWRSLGAGKKFQLERSGSSRSTLSLKGLYLEMRKQSASFRRPTALYGSSSRSSFLMSHQREVLGQAGFEAKILSGMIQDRQGAYQLRKVFESVDVDGSGEVSLDLFVKVMKKAKPGIAPSICVQMFHEADTNGDGILSLDEFMRFASMNGNEILRTLQHAEHRDDRGWLQVKPTNEDYFGQDTDASSQLTVGSFAKIESQYSAMELYESRIASLQRFVAMCVLFHQMGRSVQEFFPNVSLGFLGYRMDRTHSIMRVATTASPISGDAVRERLEVLRLQSVFHRSAGIIARSWRGYQRRHGELVTTLKARTQALKAEEERLESSISSLKAVYMNRQQSPSSGMSAVQDKLE